MIYVCRVDTGSRHIFDFADGIENVGSLASSIEKQLRIERNKQILLVSGGEVLDDYQRKFYGFGFGCEESPIYLIDKTNVEKREPPHIETPLDNLNIQDLKQEINSAINLKSSFQTLQKRAQLTYRVNELDKHINKLCQSLYDEQFWQYQGYLALVANLDDYVSSFQKKEQTVREQFDNYFNNVNSHKELMKDIDKYINLLGNIRLVPNLLNDLTQSTSEESKLETSYSSQQIDKSLNRTQSAGSNPLLKRFNNQTNLFSSISTQSITNLQSPQQKTNEIQNSKQQQTVLNQQMKKFGEHEISLLEWIKSTDPNNKLNSVIDETKDILENFEKNFKWNELNSKINKLLGQVENSQQMREIEGLTKRLEDLKGFIDESNKFLASQNEITESLKSNFERAASLKDESVLQDLCKAHERQLEIFKINHSNMIEIANKISKAKLELIRVIHSRLHWIMQVQKQIADFDFQIQIYFKQLRRLNVRLKLMEQLKKAPFVYLISLKEALRRTHFSTVYKTFAKTISQSLTTIYENEIKQRQLFESKAASFSQNFVSNILFRSLNDKIEPILNDLKLNFDNKLPVLNENDVSSVENNIINYFKQFNNNNNENLSELSSTTSSTNASTSTSSSTSSCSLSTNLTNTKTQKSTFDLENFLSKEFNIESDKQTSTQTEDLKLLTLLKDFLENKEQKSDKSQETLSNEIILDTIKNLRFKLKDTKSLINNYQTELNEYINKLTDFNHKKFDTCTQTSQGQVSKSKLYLKYLNLIEKYLKENQEFNQDDSEFDQEDKEFLKGILEQLKQFKSQNETQKEELKVSIEKMKKNFSAESQIKFNEAIKRVAVEKDKLIEELRAKQAENLATISSLQNELDRYKLNLESSEFTDSNDPLLSSDPNETKSKLRELMLQEKVNQLQKQLSMYTTLPLTSNFYETIQLNSCNIDDIVLAVYSDEYCSYKVIHKTSNYLHFVYSAVFKNFEYKLSFKSVNNAAGSSSSSKFCQYSTSPTNDPTQLEVQFSEQADMTGNQVESTAQSLITSQTGKNLICTQQPVALAEMAENSDNIFAGDKQPQWFVGKVLVKEFCVARKENNRFKVPSGTRFYRVKLKPLTNIC